jgi:hypothetical protein
MLAVLTAAGLALAPVRQNALAGACTPRRSIFVFSRSALVAAAIAAPVPSSAACQLMPQRSTNAHAPHAVAIGIAPRSVFLPPLKRRAASPGRAKAAPHGGRSTTSQGGERTSVRA